MALRVALDVEAEIDRAERHKSEAASSSASLNRAMSLGEIEAMEAISQEESKEHFAWEEREEQRERLIAYARSRSDATAVLLNDLISEDLLEPRAVRVAEEMKRKAAWDEAGNAYAEEFVAALGKPAPRSPTSLSELFDLYVRIGNSARLATHELVSLLADVFGLRRHLIPR